MKKTGKARMAAARATLTTFAAQAGARSASARQARVKIKTGPGATIYRRRGAGITYQAGKKAMLGRPASTNQARLKARAFNWPDRHSTYAARPRLGNATAQTAATSSQCQPCTSAPASGCSG